MRFPPRPVTTQSLSPPECSATWTSCSTVGTCHYCGQRVCEGQSWGPATLVSYPPTTVYHTACRSEVNSRRLDVAGAEAESLSGEDQHWPDDEVTAAAMGGYVL